MDHRQKNGPSSDALQVKAVAEACLRGEIHCSEVHKRIFPHLRQIVSTRRLERDNKTQNEPDSSVGRGIANNGTDNKLIQSFGAEEECLIQSLRLLVQRLGHIPDPLQEIYILASHVFEDFYDAISEEEYDKLLVFIELAHEEAQLVDEDRTLTTAAAHELRRQIQVAASNYLSVCARPSAG